MGRDGNSNQRGQRKTIGLALGSGGARGLAHIGVIKTLTAAGIPIDYIAGTSIGSLVGGMYDAFGDTEPLEDFARSLGYRELAQVLFDPGIGGVIKGEKATEYLEHYLNGITIESLSIPFAAVATDITSGEPVVMSSGNLAQAIRASGSIPVLFAPALVDGRYLVDGGTSIPVPASVVRSMGADIVIAVNLDAHFFPDPTAPSEKPSNYIDIGMSSVNMLRYHLARENVRHADVVITPDLSPTWLDKLAHGEHFIPHGSAAAERVLADVRRLMAT